MVPGAEILLLLSPLPLFQQCHLPQDAMLDSLSEAASHFFQLEIYPHVGHRAAPGAVGVALYDPAEASETGDLYARKVTKHTCIP